MSQRKLRPTETFLYRLLREGILTPIDEQRAREHDDALFFIVEKANRVGKMPVLIALLRNYGGVYARDISRRLEEWYEATIQGRACKIQQSVLSQLYSIVHGDNNSNMVYETHTDQNMATGQTLDKLQSQKCRLASKVEEDLFRRDFTDLTTKVCETIDDVERKCTEQETGLQQVEFQKERLIRQNASFYNKTRDLQTELNQAYSHLEFLEGSHKREMKRKEDETSYMREEIRKLQEENENLKRMISEKDEKIDQLQMRATPVQNIFYTEGPRATHNTHFAISTQLSTGNESFNSMSFNTTDYNSE